MSIGIIGAGALGSSVARLLAKSGISATIANSRGPESLAALAGELGPSIKLAPPGRPRALTSSWWLYVGSISRKR
jgi:predicted dinucleotide-binding enzyme